MHERHTVEVPGVGPVEVSTVLLGMPAGLYETCLFWKGDSEVVERYANPASARSGHARWLDPAKLKAAIYAARAAYDSILEAYDA